MSTAIEIDTPPVPRFAWSTLAKLLSVVDHAASRDTTRYNLNGILLERGAGQLVTATATDGHRLAQATTAIDPEALPLPEKGFLLSLPDAKRIRDEAKRLGKGRRTPEACAELVGGVLVIRELLDSDEPSTEVRCKAQEGEFPDYRQILPDESTLGAPVAFNGRYLAEAGKALASLNERSGGVVIRLGSDVMPARLESHSPDMDAFEIVMPMRL